ncbi:MAG TPA: AMP-binding protein [Mycobacteriales bacterium]|nr:AMP-binding protein [Mycobacteriales bacterium]
MSGPRNLADLVAHTAARRPDHTALIADDVVLTWSELNGRIDAAAAGLLSLGVGTGDRVALQLGNGPDFPVAFFAALRAGLVAVPVAPDLPVPDLADRLEDSGAAVLITSQIAAIRAEHRAGLRLVVAGEVAPDGAHSLADMVAAGGTVPGPAGGDAGAVLSYPTGADAHPRGALLSHRALLANLDQLAGIEPAPLRSSDIVLLAVPLFHTFGLGPGLCWLARVGATGVLGGDGLDALPAHRVTAVLAAPGVYAHWIAETERNELARAFATVRLALSGSAPLPAAVADAVTAATSVVLHESYGQAETAPLLTTTLMSPHRKPGSVGRAVPGVQLWLRDEVGDPVDDGDPGEILVRGPSLFSGYWPDGARPLDADGWFATGDVGYLDQDGDLFLVGRKREVITVSGFTVYPAEVEAALQTHPAVAEVAVVGTPEETVTAFVVPDDEVAAEELIAWSGRSLARFKQPSRIEFVHELPHSATGRVRRIALRAEAAGGPAAPAEEN